MKYPFIFLDTDKESATLGLYSIRWHESLSEDGLTLAQAKAEILLQALRTVYANAADHPDAIRATIDNALEKARCAA